MTQKLNSLEPKYNLDDYYAITIQPDNKIQFLGNKPHARIIKFRQHFYSLLQDCKIPYYLNMEISEPVGSLDNKSSGGRLHYHGIITFDKKQDILSWLLEYQYKLLRQARLEISKIHKDHRQTWWNYIHKRQLISEDLSVLSNWDPKAFTKKYLRHR